MDPESWDSAQTGACPGAGAGADTVARAGARAGVGAGPEACYDSHQHPQICNVKEDKN